MTIFRLCFFFLDIINNSLTHSTRDRLQINAADPQNESRGGDKQEINQYSSLMSFDFAVQLVPNLYNEKKW